MKALFLHFYDFSLHSGVSKKINYQISALKECGMDVDLCYMTIDENGFQKRVCGNTVIENYGNGSWASIAKWFRFGALTKFILENHIEFVYIRSFYNTNPPLLKMLRKLKAAGIKIVMEIPTYPYDYEVRQSPLKHRIIFDINLLCRNRLKCCLTRIVTFSDFDEIHGVKTIKISNGIDFSHIKVKVVRKEITDNFNLIGVAEIRFWHGFDRVIQGLGNYYKGKQNIEVHFDIVGDGMPSDINILVKLTKDLKLEKYIHFHGLTFGDDLEKLFENADFGIASLGRHRSGITKIKTLKNREYAARGIPFIYSEEDSDFETMPYILKAPADESPIDIMGMINFYKTLQPSPAEIRESIVNTLSWKVQMQKVIDETFNTK